MPYKTRTVTKNGQYVNVAAEGEYQALLADGWTLATSIPELDPRDLEQTRAAGLSLVDAFKGTLKLPVKATPPTGPNAVGEVYVATGGVLRVCTVAGSPGTWVNVGAQT
jgi:hypothetical protein